MWIPCLQWLLSLLNGLMAPILKGYWLHIATTAEKKAILKLTERIKHFSTDPLKRFTLEPHEPAHTDIYTLTQSSMDNFGVKCLKLAQLPASFYHFEREYHLYRSRGSKTDKRYSELCITNQKVSACYCNIKICGCCLKLFSVTLGHFSHYSYHLHNS